MHSLHPCARVPTHLIAYLVNMSHTFPLLSRAAVLLLAAGALTSCLNDDTKTENVSADCVATSFKIGQLKRKVYLRTKDNRSDSVATVEVKGELYRFTIDQQRGVIYNIDSLPPHTDLSKVEGIVVNARGGAGLREDGATNFVTQTSKQSGLTANLNGHPTVVVQSTDRTAQRTYRVEVRVHREPSDSVTWTRAANDAQAAQHFTATDLQSPWSAGGQRFELSGALPRIEVDGSWQLDSVAAEDAAEFPDAQKALCLQPAQADNHLTEITLYGWKNNVPGVWKRYVDTRAHNRFGWERLLPHREAAYRVPALTQPTLLPYDGGLLLVGLNADGRPTLRFSPDRGLTWREHTLLTLPADFPTRATRLEAALDAQQVLWLRVDHNQVWRARLHRLSWQPTPTYFYRSTHR